MNAVEFTTQLSEKPAVTIPQEIAAQLPRNGSARVIILIGPDGQDNEWRRGAYEQFARDDSPEDEVYDSY